MRSLIFLCSMLLLVSFVRASIWDILEAAEPAALLRRQEEDEPTKTEDPKTTDAPTTTADETNTDTETITGTNTKETGTNTNTKATKTSTKTKSIAPNAPAGGILMVTPSPNSPATYYKIGYDTPTFAWNYTSLIATPSAIDVVAYCSKNDHYYTISANMTVEKTGRVEWDTKLKKTDVPLLTEKYTLMVYDSSTDPTDIPDPGHLGSSNTFTFGMYTPQDYTPRTDFQCATCGAAMSTTDKQALKFVFGMATITVLSFTWFVAGLGIFA
ncbi:hypothetical protein FQN52_009154 [Onygenales sp. PD_12]|nr:hypothetical protein FQN53_008471 [Emmonsiellopsis sp. PD_33]KAK2794072.1 hypothetical protein FQN52_009154 [Onygenales sp. PD_12]